MHFSSIRHTAKNEGDQLISSKRSHQTQTNPLASLWPNTIGALPIARRLLTSTSGISTVPDGSMSFATHQTDEINAQTNHTATERSTNIGTRYVIQTAKTPCGHHHIVRLSGNLFIYQRTLCLEDQRGRTDACNSCVWKTNKGGCILNCV